MSLPLPQLESTPRPADGADDISVLFVDDDEQFGQLVADYLEDEHDYAVRVEVDATDALDVLTGPESINCIVSDYAMPEMDGLDFLQAVTDRFPEIPFVMFAGQGSEQVASRAIQLGADDYLEKDTGTARYDLLANRIENCVTIARQNRQLRTLHDAIENAGHAVLVTDKRGTITYANPTMEELSGYTAEELRGATPATFKSGEHDDEFYRDLWSTVLSGDVWEGEVVNEDKRGRQYVIDQTISPITDIDGDITGFVAVNRDITDNKERARRQSFFKQAIEQFGIGIAAYNEDGRCRYTNGAYAEMLGTTPEVLEGRHITIVNPEFDVDRFEGYWDSFDEGETRTIEAVHRNLATDETFDVEITTTRITVDGQSYNVGTIQDITDRKERERELEQFRQAVERAGHGVMITDVDGTIEYVNPAFEETTGYSRERLRGETPAVLKSGEQDESFYEDLWSTILSGDVWEGEVVNEDKHGRQRVVDQTISPITEDGEITAFVAVNHDITDIKEYERELERQNARLEKFGRTVAHDLRNPLQVMESHLEVARVCDDLEEAATAHGEIQTAIEQMRELIKELLTLAEQGQTVLEPEPASLEDVTSRAWDNVKTGEMTVRVDDEARLVMDDSRVVQLLENLFRNAREHAGSEVSVRVGTLPDGFYVEDDGPGIPPDECESVLESGYTTSEDGTGFGLAIVNQIAEAHGWTVSITEGADGGARFEFHDTTFA